MVEITYRCFVGLKCFPKGTDFFFHLIMIQPATDIFYLFAYAINDFIIVHFLPFPDVFVPLLSKCVFQKGILFLSSLSCCIRGTKTLGNASKCTMMNSLI